MKKWEYAWQVTPSLGGDAGQTAYAISLLCKAGEKGWEVASASQYGFVMKREVSEAASASERKGVILGRSLLRCANCHERLFFTFAEGPNECGGCGGTRVEPMPEATP